MSDLERVQALPKLPPRKTDSYKTMFGRVLVVGGSQGMIGAPSLAANAALRGGAGLVTFAVPRTIQPFVAVLCPCATSLPLACDDAGELAADAVGQLMNAAEQADVIAMGPGMAVSGAGRNVVQAILGQPRPVVLDAGGLMNLRDIDGWPDLRACPIILTPHPGEFSRLTGKSIKEVQADRENAAVEAAQCWRGKCDQPLVCVLKGAGTVVTDGRRIYVNRSGNPGLATGGTGDVLTGLTAALVGQGLSPFDAACLAAHVHGRAGDLAAEKLGMVSMMAGDLLEFLPQAMRETVE